MKTIATSFVAGVIFAVGLGIAGMTQADKVIAFLDVAGAWDPSLAFVMVGAIGTHALFRLLFVRGRKESIFGGAFRVPKRTDIDGSLIGGAALFGVGWAIGGYCPGPGIVSVASGSLHAIVFVVMLTGAMVAWQFTQQRAVARDSERFGAPGLTGSDS